MEFSYVGANARPMVNVNDNFNGDLWFFSYRNDVKADDIAARPQVNVSFADPSQHRYISISGKAELVQDAKRCELLWTPACEPWFPKGPRDPNIALLKVDVEQAAYWDQQRGAMIAIAGFIKRLITGDKSPHVESEHVEWPPQ